MYQKSINYVMLSYMKKILLFFILILLCCNLAYAEVVNKIKFKGDTYQLLYSVKNKEHNGYLNEYFKPGEDYNNWTELLAVHHFPNAYSPIDQAEAFRGFLNSINCPNALTIKEEDNSAIIDFILLDGDKLPIIMEFNVFKYEKSPECGTIAVQYAKRYIVSNGLEVEDIKKEFARTRNAALKKVKKFEIPEIIKEDIDKLK